MEIGKRFLEEKSGYKELNGISAKECLEKAKAMFQEMDLQWDLDELDKISVTGERLVLNFLFSGSLCCVPKIKVETNRYCHQQLELKGPKIYY